MVTTKWGSRLQEVVFTEAIQTTKNTVCKEKESGVVTDNGINVYCFVKWV